MEQQLPSKVGANLRAHADRLRSITAQVSMKDETIRSLQERLRGFESLQKSYSESVSNLTDARSKVVSLESANISLSTRVQTLENDLEQARLREEQSRRTAQTLQARVEQLQNALRDRENFGSTLQSGQIRLAGKLESAEAQMKAMRGEKETLERRLKDLRRDAADRARKLDASKENVKAVTADLRKTQQRLREQTRAAEVLEKGIADRDAVIFSVRQERETAAHAATELQEARRRIAALEAKADEAPMLMKRLGDAMRARATLEARAKELWTQLRAVEADRRRLLGQNVRLSEELRKRSSSSPASPSSLDECAAGSGPVATAGDPTEPRSPAVLAAKPSTPVVAVALSEDAHATTEKCTLTDASAEVSTVGLLDLLDAIGAPRGLDASAALQSATRLRDHEQSLQADLELSGRAAASLKAEVARLTRHCEELQRVAAACDARTRDAEEAARTSGAEKEKLVKQMSILVRAISALRQRNHQLLAQRLLLGRKAAVLARSHRETAFLSAALEGTAPRDAQSAQRTALLATCPSGPRHRIVSAITACVFAAALQGMSAARVEKAAQVHSDGLSCGQFHLAAAAPGMRFELAGRAPDSPLPRLADLAQVSAPQGECPAVSGVVGTVETIIALLGGTELSALGPVLSCALDDPALAAALPDAGAAVGRRGQGWITNFALPLYFDGAPTLEIRGSAFGTPWLPCVPGVGAMNGILFDDTLDAIGAFFESDASVDFPEPRVARVTFSHHTMMQTFHENTAAVGRAEGPLLDLGTRAHLSGHVHGPGAFYNQRKLLDFAGNALEDGFLNVAVFDGPYGPFMSTGVYDTFPHAVFTAPPHSAMAVDDMVSATVWANELRVVVLLPLPAAQLRLLLDGSAAWVFDGSASTNLTASRYDPADPSTDPRLRAPQSADGGFVQHPSSGGTERDGAVGALLFTAPWDAPAESGVLEFHLVLRTEHIDDPSALSVSVARETVLLSPYSRSGPMSTLRWIGEASAAHDVPAVPTNSLNVELGADGAVEKQYISLVAQHSEYIDATRMANTPFTVVFLLPAVLILAVMFACSFFGVYRIRRIQAAELASHVVAAAVLPPSASSSGPSMLSSNEDLLATPEAAAGPRWVAVLQSLFFPRPPLCPVPISFLVHFILFIALPLNITPRAYGDDGLSACFLWGQTASARFTEIPAGMLLQAGFIVHLVLHPIQLFGFRLLQAAFHGLQPPRAGARIAGFFRICSRRSYGVEYARIPHRTRRRLAAAASVLILVPAILMTAVGVLLDMIYIGRLTFLFDPGLVWLPFVDLASSAAQLVMVNKALSRAA
eukprot:gnl/Chilomastix_cuspidata/5215.p1 GENE.gnl/Chilomastix_cuspidata/5215~~gnl/Chilomastix_cuspidata/5215.p1  ORF type:complete len:1307 (-),score=462.01 gnl/Chilomastix_cuspidata/5215:34-3954(-)